MKTNSATDPANYKFTTDLRDVVATAAARNGSTPAATQSRPPKCWLAKVAAKRWFVADSPFARAAAAGDRWASNLPEQNAIMKTQNDDPNYRPIQFALNRAVFHKEITEAEADKGIAEHAALVAVAEAAKDLNWRDLPFKQRELLQTALATLATVRVGQSEGGAK